MMKSELLTYTALVLAGAGVGTGVTILVLNKKLKSKYEGLAQIEIEQVKEHYKKLHKADEYSTPEGAAEALAAQGESRSEEVLAENPESLRERLHELGYSQAAEILEANGTNTSAQVLNVFDIREEVDEATRVDEYPIFPVDPDNPYLIPVSEFMDDSNNYEKISITYFEGDDTLADERDMIIPDIAGTVGLESLNKFGYGSDSSSTVYVRNQRLNTDFEIIKREDEYSAFVFGGSSSNMERPNKIRKMRPDDD